MRRTSFIQIRIVNTLGHDILGDLSNYHEWIEVEQIIL